MTAAYVVGRDQEAAEPTGPAGSARGVFAQWLQGATPKYAKNDQGLRADLFRDTLARLFVRLTTEEQNPGGLFARSIADDHTRENIAPRLAGDPRGDVGYADFLVGEMNLQLAEKIQVSETLGDNFVLFAFGRQAPVLSLSGVLLNTVQDDQASNFLRVYTELLSATQLGKRLKAVSLKIDSYIFTGAFTNLNLQWRGALEVAVPFSAQLVVAKIAYVNVTRGWRPTGVGTPFATDLNAVPLDARLGSTPARAPVAIGLSVPSSLTPAQANAAASGQEPPAPASAPAPGSSSTVTRPRAHTPATPPGASPRTRVAPPPRVPTTLQALHPYARALTRADARVARATTAANALPAGATQAQRDAARRELFAAYDAQNQARTEYQQAVTNARRIAASRSTPQPTAPAVARTARPETTPPPSPVGL